MSVNEGFLLAQIINCSLWLLIPILLIGGVVWFIKNYAPANSDEFKQARQQIGELQRENGRLQDELDALKGQFNK